MRGDPTPTFRSNGARIKGVRIFGELDEKLENLSKR
jgi:hypothetical protein